MESTFLGLSLVIYLGFQGFYFCLFFVFLVLFFFLVVCVCFVLIFCFGCVSVLAGLGWCGARMAPQQANPFLFFFCVFVGYFYFCLVVHFQVNEKPADKQRKNGFKFFGAPFGGRMFRETTEEKNAPKPFFVLLGSPFLPLFIFLPFGFLSFLPFFLSSFFIFLLLLQSERDKESKRRRQKETIRTQERNNNKQRKKTKKIITRRGQEG